MASSLDVKVAVLVLIGVLPFLFALLPWLIQVIINVGCCGKRNGIELAEKILNYFNFVAGGIFLGLILLHLIPEVQEEMAESLEAAGIKTHYPFGPFLVALGLVAFVVLEQIVMSCSSGGHNHQDSDARPSNHLHQHADVLTFAPKQGSCEGTGLTHSYKQGNSNRSYQAISASESGCDIEDNLLHAHTDVKTPNPTRRKNSLLRTYALLTALSLHSIFEGMMIGFQDTESVLWELFVAIIFHKCLVAFSLGSRLLKSVQQLSLKHYFGLIVVFCLMSPVGGTVAALLADYSHSNALKLTENILTALATGSFMFVTFFEILKFDYDSNVNLVGVFCLILGFGAYALELYLEGGGGHVH